eukprot:880358-Rhodomonas_salina.1
MNIYLARVEAGEEPGDVVDESMTADHIERWCARNEGILWVPLVSPPPNEHRGHIAGPGLKVASLQTGPKGGNFA